MFRRLICVVAVCVLAGMVGVAQAKDPAASGKNPSSKTAQKPATKTLKGTIAHVDLEAKRLKLEVKDKQQQTSTVEVATDDKTEIMLDNAAVTLADLRDGMKVTAAVGADSGIAMRITAKSEPKGKSAKN